MSKIIEDMRLQSYKEGKAEGQEENKRETALRMLEVGKYSLDEISTISGLSLDEVKDLSAGKTA